MTVTGDVMDKSPTAMRSVMLCATGAKATFGFADVAAWGAMRCYGRSGRLTLARLTDGRVVCIAKSKQPKEVAKEIERRTKGLDVSSPAVTCTGLQNVAWRDVTPEAQ